MEYKFTTPYARFQEWLDQCPVEIVNYADFTDTFDVTFKVPVEEEVDNSSDYLIVYQKVRTMVAKLMHLWIAWV